VALQTHPKLRRASPNVKYDLAGVSGRRPRAASRSSSGMGPAKGAQCVCSRPGDDGMSRTMLVMPGTIPSERLSGPKSERYGRQGGRPFWLCVACEENSSRNRARATSSWGKRIPSYGDRPVRVTGGPGSGTVGSFQGVGREGKRDTPVGQAGHSCDAFRSGVRKLRLLRDGAGRLGTESRSASTALSSDPSSSPDVPRPLRSHGGAWERGAPFSRWERGAFCLGSGESLPFRGEPTHQRCP
jgi:hypothetical protein